MTSVYFFFFQAEDGIRDATVTGVQTCALPICERLDRRGAEDQAVHERGRPPQGQGDRGQDAGEGSPPLPRRRSEERRVGKSVDLGGRRIMKKKVGTIVRKSVNTSQQGASTAGG